MRPNPIPDRLVGTIRFHEGSLLVEVDGQVYPSTGALVVASVVPPHDAHATMLPHAFCVVGDWTRHSLALAQFMVANPSYARMVQGMVEIIASGRIDGGYGAGCPVHDPRPDAPAPGGREEGEGQ